MCSISNMWGWKKHGGRCIPRGVRGNQCDMCDSVTHSMRDCASTHQQLASLGVHAEWWMDTGVEKVTGNSGDVTGTRNLYCM